MRSNHHFPAVLAFAFLVSLPLAPLAVAQTTQQAEDEAERAQRRADVATGLVGEAVANRDEIERQLAESIARMNELSAELSVAGADLERIAAQVGFADVALAGIQSDIEDQAIDAYMTVVASPSVSVVNSASVEKALVASSVVEDVVADGRDTVTELFAKRKGLLALQETYATEQEQFQHLQEEVDAEVARYTSLYEQADTEVAAAIREADAADRAYRAALSAVEIAKAKEDERQRQENRANPAPTSTSTTSTPSTASPSTSATTPSTTSTSTTTPPATSTTTTDPPSPTTTAPPPTTTSTSPSTQQHPSHIEQWRTLVKQHFPSHRVDEALSLIDCESNGDADAVNPYSGAAGLFQFLPSTWATTAPNAGYSGYDPTDAEANVGTAAWLANRYQELGYYYWYPWNCKWVLD